MTVKELEKQVKELKERIEQLEAKLPGGKSFDVTVSEIVSGLHAAGYAPRKVR